jgi:ferric-chelate reductase
VTEADIYTNIYSSYVVDPTWQIKFTIIWCSVLAAAVVFSLPRVIALRRFLFIGVFGINEELDSRGKYDAVPDNNKNRNSAQQLPKGKKGVLQALAHSAVAGFYWTIPRVEMNLGQSRFNLFFQVTLCS